MRLLEQVQREQFIILKTRYDPGVENQPQTVSQLASQSHMFNVSGGKPIDKNNSLSYWFVIGYCFLTQFSSVQSLSHVRLFVTPWIAARQDSLYITNSRSSLKLTFIESVMPSSHLIMLSPFPPGPNPSQHQSLFQWVNSLHEVAKVLEFQL